MEFIGRKHTEEAMKKPSVKVVFNIWGNYGCFIGTNKVTDTAEEFTAKVWLAGMLKSGAYRLSDKSHLSAADVAAYEQFAE